jgi:hypothetical protein
LKTRKFYPQGLAVEQEWFDAFVVALDEPSSSGRFANVSFGCGFLNPVGG